MSIYRQGTDTTGLATTSFGSILQAFERGFFQDPVFDIRTFEENIDKLGDGKIYDLVEVKEDAIGKINCHQPRGPDAPNKDDILRSLYRSAKDKDDFIFSRACNSTSNCKFSWDTPEPNMDADYPFRGGSTCVMASGDHERHTTHHQLLIQKGPGEDLGDQDWRVLAVSGIIDQYIINEDNYGGYWSDGNGRLVNISNSAYQWKLNGEAPENFPPFFPVYVEK